MVFLYRLNRKVYGIPVDSTNLLALLFDFSIFFRKGGWQGAGAVSRVAKPLATSILPVDYS
jgi:hypothetical protein